MPLKPIQPALQIIDVFGIPYMPSDLNLSPAMPERVTLATHVQPTLTTLHGRTVTGNQSIHATQDNELKVATGDTDIDTYEVVTGSLPASFGSSAQLLYDHLVTNWMIDVEGAALARFRDRDGVTWGDEIRIRSGVFPVGIKATGCQLKSVVGGSETFYLTGFWEGGS